jgi:serine/threonine protein kinase
LEYDYGGEKASGRARIRSDCRIDYETLNFQKIIGKGGEGVVWKGEWVGCDVAIKVIAVENGCGVESQLSLNDKLYQEVRIYQALRHPHVVLFYGVAVKHEKESFELATVIELLQCSLKDFLQVQSNKISVVQTLEVLIQVEKGMRYLHGRGVLHRDLKSGLLIC